MKQKLLPAVIFLAITGLVLTGADPLSLALNFIVGGVIPGLDITLGFLPSLAFIILLIMLIRRWIKDLRFQMIRRTALEINAENSKLALADATTKERRERQAATITAARAPKLKTAV